MAIFTALALFAVTTSAAIGVACWGRSYLAREDAVDAKLDYWEAISAR